MSDVGMGFVVLVALPVFSPVAVAISRLYRAILGLDVPGPLVAAVVRQFGRDPDDTGWKVTIAVELVVYGLALLAVLLALIFVGATLFIVPYGFVVVALYVVVGIALLAKWWWSAPASDPAKARAVVGHVAVVYAVWTVLAQLLSTGSYLLGPSKHDLLGVVLPLPLSSFVLGTLIVGCIAAYRRRRRQFTGAREMVLSGTALAVFGFAVEYRFQTTVLDHFYPTGSELLWPTVAAHAARVGVLLVLVGSVFLLEDGQGETSPDPTGSSTGERDPIPDS